MLADWLQANTGIDPAADFRGTYATEAEANDLYRRGGPVYMAGQLLATSGIGFAETRAPMPGDVGMLDLIGGPTGAIKTAKGWAAKAPRGIAYFRSRAFQIAWSVPLCRQPSPL